VLVSEETYATVKNYCSAVKLVPALVKGRVNPITVYSIRGILQHDNSLLLTIPLIIMTPEGGIAGSGLATMYHLSEGSHELHIDSVATIPPWSTLLLQFDLPELSVAPRLTGRILSTYRKSGEYTTPYTHIILTELTGDSAAFTLLRAGACIESRKDWGDMMRH
jgi:hypothetical protein